MDPAPVLVTFVSLRANTRQKQQYWRKDPFWFIRGWQSIMVGSQSSVAQPVTAQPCAGVIYTGAESRGAGSSRAWELTKLPA